MPHDGGVERNGRSLGSAYMYWTTQPSSAPNRPPNPPTGVYFTQPPRRTPVARVLVLGSDVPEQTKNTFQTSWRPRRARRARHCLPVCRVKGLVRFPATRTSYDHNGTSVRPTAARAVVLRRRPALGGRAADRHGVSGGSDRAATDRLGRCLRRRVFRRVGGAVAAAVHLHPAPKVGRHRLVRRAPRRDRRRERRREPERAAHDERARAVAVHVVAVRRGARRWPVARERTVEGERARACVHAAAAVPMTHLRASSRFQRGRGQGGVGR